MIGARLVAILAAKTPSIVVPVRSGCLLDSLTPANALVSSLENTTMGWAQSRSNPTIPQTADVQPCSRDRMGVPSARGTSTRGRLTPRGE